MTRLRFIKALRFLLLQSLKRRKLRSPRVSSPHYVSEWLSHDELSFDVALTSSNAKTCDCESSGKCDCSTAKPAQSSIRSSPSCASSGPRTPPPTSSCCAGKRNTSSESRPQLQSTPSSDKRTAVLLEELARSVPTSSSYSAAQPYPPPTIQASTSSNTSSVGWGGLKVGACGCGPACACPGKIVPPLPMPLF